MALNLQTNLGALAVLNVSDPPFHEHGLSSTDFFFLTVKYIWDNFAKKRKVKENLDLRNQ